MICDGYPNEGKGACIGDSGGPFVCNDNYKAVAVGVISFGIGCGGAYPDGNARNTYVLNWIKTNMVTTNIEKRMITTFNIKTFSTGFMFQDSLNIHGIAWH